MANVSRFPRQLLPALLYLLHPCSRAPAAVLRKAAALNGVVLTHCVGCGGDLKQVNSGRI